MSTEKVLSKEVSLGEGLRNDIRCAVSLLMFILEDDRMFDLVEARISELQAERARIEAEKSKLEEVAKQSANGVVQNHS